MLLLFASIVHKCHRVIYSTLLNSICMKQGIKQMDHLNFGVYGKWQILHIGAPRLVRT